MERDINAFETVQKLFFSIWETVNLHSVYFHLFFILPQLNI